MQDLLKLTISNGVKETVSGLKSVKTEQGLEVEGYLSVYGEVDSDRDIVLPGSFDEFIVEFNQKKESDPRCLPLLFRHRWDVKVGYVKELISDGKGLMCKALILFEKPEGRLIADMVMRKEVNGFSYHFINGIGFRREGIRYISKAQLIEATLTPFPANKLALIRSFNGNKERYKDWKLTLLNVLRLDGMLTNSEARTMFASGRKSLDITDDEADTMLQILNRMQ